MDGEQKIFGLGADELIEGKKSAKPLEKQAFSAQTQDKFNAALNDPNAKGQVQATNAIDTKPNPLDVAKNIYTQQHEGTNTIDNIEHQVAKVNDRIDQIKETLQAPDVTIKHSYQSLLENKLTHIDESLQVALQKVGVEYEPATEAAAPTAKAVGVEDAIQKFLGFLSDSQSKLNSVTQDVQNFKNKTTETGQMSPADLLAVQLKVSFVQQELELFANLLNKALESTKTVMNVQI